MLALPPEILRWLADMDFDANWKTQSVFGQEFPKLMNGYLANGWVKLDSDLFPNFVAERDGLVLMVRPRFISDKARKADAARARGPIQAREMMLGSTGVPNVTGGNHPSALRHNRINKTIEQIEIARDD